MPITYTNEKGKTYYLHQGVTKKGKPKFFFSPKSEGCLAESVPEGFEIWEDPATAQVFLRKPVPTAIRPEEVRVVEDELRRHPHLKGCRLDVREKAITVFAQDQDPSDVGHLLDRFAWIPSSVIREWGERFVHRSPQMRFVLYDERRRIFHAQRWCYLGSIDTWFPLGRPGRLDALVSTFLKHVGQESFFELM